MPVGSNYPGVYIEEIPSGVRPIVPVGTSVAAFVGWARRGPIDEPKRVRSMGDFERHFGGLDPASYLGYAVQHFFGNGGQDAYIVRLVAGNARVATASVQGKLAVAARNPGVWAERYGITVTAHPTDQFRFHLAVVTVDASGGPGRQVEVHSDVSMDEADARFVGAVLDESSAIVSASVIGSPAGPLTATADPVQLASGDDGDILEPNSAGFEAQLTGVANSGVYLLDNVDSFNLLCVPGETTACEIAKLQEYCRDKRSFLIVDCQQDASLKSLGRGPDALLTGADSMNSAFYFPWVEAPDPLQGDRVREFPPSGFVAGVIARTDSHRGVWKAPAGLNANLAGVAGLKEQLTHRENRIVNTKAINCLRYFDSRGNVVWGARTLDGSDTKGSEWKYIPVRRTALFIEESLHRALQWVVFEPNDEPTWAQIRAGVGAFMQGLFRHGAFQGSTPEEAYFVKCGTETTTQSDIDQGVVNIAVGFAPLRPAEFVVIHIQQPAGTA